MGPANSGLNNSVQGQVLPEGSRELFTPREAPPKKKNNHVTSIFRNKSKKVLQLWAQQTNHVPHDVYILPTFIVQKNMYNS